MEKRNLRKERIGVVSSNKMDKTIVVLEVKLVKLSWLAGPLMIRFTGLDRLAKRNPYLYSQVCDCVAFWQQYWENTPTRWVLIES